MSRSSPNRWTFSSTWPSTLESCAPSAGSSASRGNAFVSDDVLTHAIWELRKAFDNDSKDPLYIETIPRKGYRLIAPVVWPSSATDESSSTFHYKDLVRLGGGGMGVVYKATDTSLDRPVALKFLPPELSEDQVSRRRFIREAKSAAQLDHPNIATVHGIGQGDDGRTFIAMAYYDGETVKKKIETDRIDSRRSQPCRADRPRSFRCALQEDLAPRYQARQRDDRRQGAKRQRRQDRRLRPRQTRRHHISYASRSDTPATVAYMSPEQLLGKKIDHRTDLWSLGVVLYEMVAGKRPFNGATGGSTVQSIINEEPESLLDVRADCPQVVSNIVEALLRKEPDERMGDATEVANRLADAKLSSDLTETMPVNPVRKIAADKLAPEDSGGPSQGVASSRRTIHRVAFGLLALALLAITWLILDGINRRSKNPLEGRPRQLTSAPGWKSEPAISPDGQDIAYVSNESGNADIWVVDAHGGPALQLTDSPKADHHPAWFPDGSAIVFQSDGEGELGLWKVSRLGGRPIPLLSGAIEPSISPAGTHMAFARPNPDGDLRIAVAKLDALPESQTLTTGQDGEWDHHSPSWSPDGKWIAYSDLKDLWVISAEGGDSRRLTEDAAGDLEPQWSRDGRSVLFTSYRENTVAIWSIPSGGGQPKRLTSGTGPERHVTIAADTSTVSYTTSLANRDIVIHNLSAGRHERLKSLRYEGQPTLAPGGSAVVFVSDRWKGFHLWRQELDGLLPVGNPTLLNEEAAYSSNPDYSPDGRWITYQRRIGHQRDIWIHPSRSGFAWQLTSDVDEDWHPAWSPDGTRIAFVSNRGGQEGVWVATIDDRKVQGTPYRVDTVGANLVSPEWSPDGSELAYIAAREGVWDIWVTGADGLQSARQVTKQASAFQVRWHPSNGSLLVAGYWGREALTLCEVEPTTGEIVREITAVGFGPSNRSGSFSVDLGTQGDVLLASTWAETTGDIWLVEVDD